MRVRTSDSKALECPACRPALRVGNDLRQRHPPCGIYLMPPMTEDLLPPTAPVTVRALLSAAFSLDGTLTTSVKSPSAGGWGRESSISQQLRCPEPPLGQVPCKRSVVTPMKHVRPTHEETEARRREGLGLGLHSRSEPNHFATRPWPPGPHPKLKRYRGAEGRGHCGRGWAWATGVPAQAWEEEATREEPEWRLLETASPAPHTQAPHEPRDEPLRQPPPRLLQSRSVGLELPQTHQALPDFQEHRCSLGHAMGICARVLPLPQKRREAPQSQGLTLLKFVGSATT